MDSDDIFWIGINDIAKEGEYVYDSNLQPVIFENWFFDHPENYSKIQDCVAVAKRLGEPFWDDKECETKLPFICQELD